MNICEGCIKQDVCKFKESVPDFEEAIKDGEMLPFAEPLEVTCKYKEVEDDGDECPDNPVWRLYPYGCPPQTTWTDTSPRCDTTTTCGKEW